jgi:hypothetical protein
MAQDIPGTDLSQVAKKETYKPSRIAERQRGTTTVEEKAQLGVAKGGREVGHQ